MQTILALDVSTTTIGICILKKSKKTTIKSLSHYKPLNVDLDSSDIVDMLSEAKQHILGIIDKYKPTHIVIENIIKFMQGKSNANSTLYLAILNRTLALAIYEHCGLKPNFLNVNTIRARLKKEAGREEKVKKEDVPEVLEEIMKINFPYIYVTNKRTKKQKIAVESYDMADAVAVGYVYSLGI